MFGKRRSSTSSNVSSSRSTTSQSQPPAAPQLNLSVSVYARVRPSIPLDCPSGLLQDVNTDGEVIPPVPLLQTFPEDNAIIVARSHADSSPQRFILDGIFPGTASQREVHRQTGTLGAVEQVLSGSNAVILVYGQTGSGKTFTVFGPPSSGGLEAVGARDASLLGLLPRALHDVFEKSDVKRSSLSGGSIKIDVSIRYLQLYNDTWIDLLDVSGVDRGGGDRTTYINADAKLTPASASLHHCADVRTALQLLHRGDRRKVVAATSMNSTSSRGHTLFQIVLCQEERVASSSSSSSSSSFTSTTTLSFLDLAGSERISKSNAEGLQLTEAKSINKSLHGLSICLSAVANSVLKQQQMFSGTVAISSDSSSNSSFIPWRTSKLTRFLQSCLAEPLGTSSSLSICRKCLLGLIVCVSPSDSSAYESLSTLAFASRARAVTVALAGDFSAARAALSDTTYIIGTSRVRRHASSGANSDVEMYSSLPPSNDVSDAETEDDVSTSTRGGEGGGEILGKVLDQQRTQIGSLTLSYETLLAANKQLQMKLDAAESEAKKLREIKEKIEASNKLNPAASDEPRVVVMALPSTPVAIVTTPATKDVSCDPVVLASSDQIIHADSSTPSVDVSETTQPHQTSILNESTDLESLLASALASGNLETLRSAVEQVAASTVRLGSIDATPKPPLRNTTLSLEELSTLPMTPMLSLPTPTASVPSSSLLALTETPNTDDQPAAGARSTSRSRPSHDTAWKKSLRGGSNTSPFSKSSLPPPSPSRAPQTLLQLAEMKSPSRSVSVSKSRSSSSGHFPSSTKKSQSPAPTLSHFLTSSSPMPPAFEMFLSPMPPQSSHALNSAPSPSEEVFALAAKGGMRKQLSDARNFAASDLLKSPDGNDEPSDLLDIPLSPEERSEFDSPASAAPAAISPPPPPPPPGHSLQNNIAQPHIARSSTHNHRSSKSISVPFPPINVPPTNVLSGSSSGDPGVAIAAVQAALNRAQNVLTRLQNQQHDLHLTSHQNRLHQGLAPPPLPHQPHPSSHQPLYQELKEIHKSQLQTIPQDIEQEGEEDEKVNESSMLIHHVEETTEEASNALTEAESATITGSTVISVDKADPSVKEDGEAKEDANLVRNEVSMAPTNVINEEIPIFSTELVNEKGVVKHSEDDSLNHTSDVSPVVSVSPLQLVPQSMLQHEDTPKLDEHHHASTMIFNTQEVRMVAAEVAGTLAAKALEAMQAQIEKQQEQLVALQLQQERMLQERERAVAERTVATERQNDAVTLPSVATSTATQGPTLHIDHDVIKEKNSVHDAVIEKKEEEMSVKELVSEEETDDNEDQDSLAPALTSAMTLTAAAEAAVSAVNLSSSLSRSRRSSSFGGSSDLSASANSSIDVVSALQNARAALARALSAVSDANDDDDGDDESYLFPASSSAERLLPVSVTVVPQPSVSSSTVTATLPAATFVLESHSTPSIQEALPIQQTKPSQAAGVVGTNVVRALQGQRTPLFDSHLLGKQTVSTPQSVSTTLPQQIYISASSASSSASKAAAEAVAAAAAVALSRENAQRETAHLQQRTRADPINVSPLVYNSLVQPKHTPQNVLVTPPPIRSSRDSENRNYSATATAKFETPIESETVTVFVPGQGIVVMSKAKLAAMHVPVDTSKRAHIDDRGNLNVTVNHGDDSVTENVILNDEVPIIKFPELRSAVPPPQNLVSRRFGANL